MKYKFLLSIASLIVLPAAVASAATLYNNGTFNGQDGNGLGDARQAEDFTLSTTVNLTAIRFWTLEDTGGYLGSITWSVNSNSADDTPGATIGGGNLNPTRQNVGSGSGLSVFQYDFDINLTNVAAGTYWLVLHNGLDSDVDFQDLYWAHTSPNAVNSATIRGLEQTLPGGTTWDTTSREHAFMVFGDSPGAPEIPEPKAIALISSGMVVLWFTRKSISNQASAR